MAKQINILTDAAIAKLDAGRHPDGNGLNIQVSATGSKSWQLLFTSPTRKKRREMGLGSYTGTGNAETVSIKLARELAADARKLVAQGIDPIDARDAKVAQAKSEMARAGVTFWNTVERTIKVLSPEWKPGADGVREQERHWVRTMKKYAKDILDKPIEDINDDDIVAIVDPIWISKPKMAKDVLHRLFLTMEHAINVKPALYVKPNPARYKHHIEVLVGKRIPNKLRVKQHPSLPYKQTPAFMAQLRHLAMVEGLLAAQVLYFIVLTGVRSIEARGATWDEIDEDEKLWTIPAIRMKALVEHQVPLSDEAMALLGKLKGRIGSNLLFPAEHTGKVINQSVLHRLFSDGRGEERSFDLKGVATIHGFRSTLRTWAGKQKRWTEKAMEHTLAHAYGNAVQNAYDRGDTLDDRRELLQAWADFCLSTAVGNTGNVVAFPFKKAA